MFRPVTYREFIKVLKELGFELKSHNGTSHEQWQHINFNGSRRLVSVSGHHAPYAKWLLVSMLRQAGLSKKELISCIRKKGYCQELQLKYGS